MTRSRSLTLAAVGGTIAVVGAMALPMAATAAPGDDVLVFSNASVVDFDEEYVRISDALTAGGFDVIPFDGGDGSQGAWETALTDIEVFVLPEQEPGEVYDPSSPPSWMSEAGFDAIVDWIQAGGRMLISGSCMYDQGGSLYFFNEATGVDYSGVLGDCTEVDSATRYIDDASLPAALDYVDGNYTLDLARFSEAQLAPLTVWYAGLLCGQEQLSAGTFEAGSGEILFHAYDYFPDGSSNQDAWNEVLVSLIDGNAAASTWSPAVEGPAKDPISATTDAGEELYALSETACGDGEGGDDDGFGVYRVDPGTALAAPVSEVTDGWALQGDWDEASGFGYFPMNDEPSLLMQLDPATGEVTEIDYFSLGGVTFDHYDIVYSLAIGPDGSAYAIAEVDFEDEIGHSPALFELDLSDASMNFVAILDDDKLYDSFAFSVDPVTGVYYVIDEDSWELFELDVETGGLTSLGVLTGGSLVGEGEENYSDVTALQIGYDGTFWVAYSVDGEAEVSMIASFTLDDISGGDVPVSDVGILTDDEMMTYSLLLVGGEVLAATGAAPELPLGIAALLLLLGTALIVARLARHRQA